MGPVARKRRRWRRIGILAILIALAAGGAAFALDRKDESNHAPPATEVVRRGDVKATVAGVGTLQATKSVNLGFGAGGTVTSVNVKLGQHVESGEILARVDDTVAQTSLSAARSQVAAAEAKLAQLLEGHTPEERNKVSVTNTAAAKAAASARQAASKARTVAKSEVAVLRDAIRQAESNHRAAARRLGESRAKLAAKQRQESTVQLAMDAAKVAVSQARARILALAAVREANRKKIEEEERREQEEGKEGGSPRSTESGSSFAEVQAQDQLEIAQGALTDTQAEFERVRGEVDTLRTSLPDQLDTVRSSADAVATATRALDAGRATSAQTLRSALEAAETARSNLSTTIAGGAVENQPTRSAEVEEALAAISQAEASVTSGEKALEETVLRAPTAGQVANLKLAVGDVVPGGSAAQKTTPSSAGGDDSGGAGGEEGGSTGSSGSGGASGSSSAPIVLTNPRLRMFEVLLTQGDAVKVKPGDSAELTIDALHRSVKGRLVSVTPLPQVKNGVVNYTAILSTDGLPDEVRVGMTAEVTLVTAQRQGVTVLSRAALPTSTGTTRLEVLSHGKRETRVVKLGVAGDETVEVKSGLKPGEHVLLPSQPGFGGEEEAGGGEFGEEEFGEEFGGFEE